MRFAKTRSAHKEQIPAVTSEFFGIPAAAVFHRFHHVARTFFGSCGVGRVVICEKIVECAFRKRVAESGAIIALFGDHSAQAVAHIIADISLIAAFLA